MVKVELRGVEYEFRLNLGVLLAAETATSGMEKAEVTPFRMALILQYACLQQDEKFTMSYDEFLSSIETQEELDKLNNALAAEEKRWAARNGLTGVTKEEQESEKKK